MSKILSAKQIREWDAYTIKNEPVASIDLMERACQTFVQWFVARFDATNKVGIVCGTGNNGGDGLGIARLLNDWKFPVTVWIVRGSVGESEDFKKNLEKLDEKIALYEITSSSDRGLFNDRDVLIDALFGSGLSRPVEGIYSQAIDCINSTHAIRVAVDIPSGLSADAHSDGNKVRADYTLSFQSPKLAFFLPQNQDFVGNWETLDIGLSKKFLNEAHSDRIYVTRKIIRSILKTRKRFSHKGDFGKALLISGSNGKMGACILAARAALRAGAGLLTLHIPAGGNVIAQTAVPEAMVSTDVNENIISACPDLAAYDVVGVGPGLGTDVVTQTAFRKVLQAKRPMVIDADALNILASDRNLLEMVSPGSILTPHPGEFQRLVESWSNDFERLEKQIELAKKLRSIVLVKGANTSIATPDGKVHFNSTGNPGMATGGSGDVLTGVLTALLGQGYSAEDATLMGVYLHGLAGDLGSHEKGEHSLIASDIIDFLPAAFLQAKR